MSAGDVKFIGWTGTNPHYQELPPEISYEPLTGRRNFFAKPEDPLLGIPRIDTENYLIKRITRRLVCFEKDKNQVIGLLKFNNAQFSLPFVNASGQQENVDMGGGWQLLNIADARYRVGYSIITATYTKVAFAGFEFGLPPDYKVACENGVARIMYKNTVLEEIDSGTGVCGIPLDVIINTKATVGRTEIRTPIPFYESSLRYVIGIAGYRTTYEKYWVIDGVQTNNADIVNNALFSEIYLVSNGVVVDKTEIYGKELSSEIIESSKSEILDEVDFEYISPEVTNRPGFIQMRQEYPLGILQTNDFFAEQTLTQQRIQEIKDVYAQEYPNTEFATYEFDVKQEQSLSVTWLSNKVYAPGYTIQSGYGTAIPSAPIIFKAKSFVTVTIKESKRMPSTTFAPSISWSITEQNNKTILRLGGGGITIREYDVTGLS
jgi:hypothetical protein